ncbi:hypothetical protein K1719_008400 [Acacia pycnantha]|nr:hypothetical protein K1719_008400 [Acacia pycnantha]
MAHTPSANDSYTFPSQTLPEVKQRLSLWQIAPRGIRLLGSHVLVKEIVMGDMTSSGTFTRSTKLTMSYRTCTKEEGQFFLGDVLPGGSLDLVVLNPFKQRIWYFDLDHGDIDNRPQMVEVFNNICGNQMRASTMGTVP